MLQKGDKAPDFSLPGTDGKEYSLSDFSDKKLVLYFYPKDMTSGCTLQANGFSERYPSFCEKDAVVVGISPDSIQKHIRFKDKEKIPFLLLSDPEALVARSYGAYGKKKLYGHEYEAVIRSTFVIEKGIIVSAEYNVKPKENPQKTLEIIK